MPLSDEEQRLLEQMERALVEEDPRFASTLRGTRFARATKARLVVAVVAFVIGLVLLMSGVVLGTGVAGQALLGVAGFVVMLGSATVGLTAWRNRQASNEREDQESAAQGGADAAGLSVIQGGKSARKPGKQARPKNKRGARSSASFMQRMEERWQRRRGEGGF